MPEVSNLSFTRYHPHYKENPTMIQSTYNHFQTLLLPPRKLLSVPGALSNCIFKYTAYHPHYKKKREMIESAYKPSLLRSLLQFLLLPSASSDHVIKFSTYYPHYKDEQVSLTFSKTYLTISKCTTLFKCQLGLTLASFSLLADISSIKLTSQKAFQGIKDQKYLNSTQNLPEASFDPFRIIQTVDFLPANITLLNKQLWLPITYQSRGISYVKLNQNTLQLVISTNALVELFAMAHEFEIEKQHWERYQIVQAKLPQHKYYGMSGTGKHEIGKYEEGKDGTSKHWHLTTFRKSC